MNPRLIILAAAIAVSCDAPAPANISWEIKPVLNCQQRIPEIRSVRLTVIGARSGTECVEESRCIVLRSPRPERIADVQAAIPKDFSFDLLAERGYQFEAIGYGSSDCTLGSTFGTYRFCGQSDVLKFDHDQNVTIPARCSPLELPDCAGLNASLRPCR